MKVIPRKQWTPRNVNLSAMSTPQKDVFIHHTVGAQGTGTEASEKDIMRQTESYHINSRGYAAIAYNFVVFPTGRVYEGRGWAKDGGHTYNHNSTSHAICFAGNFENQKPSAKALNTARSIMRSGIARGAITGDPLIRGHRDVGGQFGGTVCPGKYLYAELGYIRNYDLDPVAAVYVVAGKTFGKLRNALKRAKNRIKGADIGQKVVIKKRRRK